MGHDAMKRPYFYRTPKKAPYLAPSDSLWIKDLCLEDPKTFVKCLKYFVPENDEEKAVLEAWYQETKTRLGYTEILQNLSFQESFLSLYNTYHNKYSVSNSEIRYTILAEMQENLRRIVHHIEFLPAWFLQCSKFDKGLMPINRDKKRIDFTQMESGIICHQVNCQGVAGAGLAKSLINTYGEESFYSYKKFCKENKDKSILGNVIVADTNSPKVKIAHIFSQLNYGREATVYTDYPSLQKGLEKVLKDYKGSKVYVSENIGCGLANGNPLLVKSLLSFLPEENLIICLK